MAAAKVLSLVLAVSGGADGLLVGTQKQNQQQQQQQHSLDIESGSSSGAFNFDSFLEKFSESHSARAAREGAVEELARRKALFEQTAAVAWQQNRQANRRWTAGFNKYWDWNEGEMASLMGYHPEIESASAGPTGDLRGTSSRAGPVALLEDVDMARKLPGNESGLADLPLEVDWRDLQSLASIRNQGACGSCWAIASTTVLEAHTELHTGKQRTFSTQQLVSCVANPNHCGGEGGCKGATVELAMDYVMKNGLSPENEVPYMAEDITCKLPSTTVVLAGKTKGLEATSFGMNGWEKLPENSYVPLMKALVERGPVAVSVAASGWGTYQTGVFDGCSPDAIVNHAVVMVGFGADADKYWILQNSWGADWGEKGYMRVLRRDNDATNCGVDRKPEQGTGCIGGPKEVTVCGMCGLLYDSVVPHFLE